MRHKPCEAGGLQVWSKLGIHRETISKSKHRRKRRRRRRMGRKMRSRRKAKV